MAKTESLTVEILKQIRAEGKKTRDEVKQTRDDLSASIEEVRDEVTQTRYELSARVDSVEGAVNELATQMVFVVRHIKQTSPLCRETARDVDELKQRVDTLEVHTGVKKGNP
jgi:methyl-accepting chemotaxis protein